jgi:hypothetical protein
MLNFDLYTEAVKRLPIKHIDSHESDLYIKLTNKSKLLVDKYRKTLIKEYGRFADTITTFKSNRPEENGALWYEIPFHYTPFWTERGCS